MYNTRANSIREGGRSGEKDITPQVQEQALPQVQEQVPSQVPNDPPIGNAIFEEFRASMTLLVQSLLAKDNREELDLANLTRVMGTT